MKAHLQYLSYVLRHKWHVFVAGRVLHVPLWQLLIHDLSKFSRAEWGPYVRRFYGGRGGVLDKGSDPEEFRQAWAHHWQNNPHHPEYWTRDNTRLLDRLIESNSRQWAWALLKLGFIPPMPDSYLREMVADWYGAARAQGKEDCWAWYRKNRNCYPISEEAHEAVQAHLLTLQSAGLIRSEFA